IPAALELQSGVVSPAHFTTKGPGLPILLVFLGPLVSGDMFAAAKLVNTLAASLALWAIFKCFGGQLGGRAGLVIAIGVLVNPTFLQATLEAGTDLPALALGFAATAMALGAAGKGRLFLAGALAASAVLTRSNYVFLPFATTVLILRSPSRIRRLLPYLAGFVLPLVSWLTVFYVKTGALPRDTNYLNLAYAIYGSSSPWETFANTAAAYFRSYADVLRLDPLLVAGRLAMNIATRWTLDASTLLPVPLGILGIVGVLLLWQRQKARGFLIAHFSLAYLLLCLAFYSPRFGLYLLPFYLSGVALLMLWTQDASPAEAKEGQWARWSVSKWSGVTIVAILYAGSAFLAARQVATLLAQTPHVVREVAIAFRGTQRPGTRVMARKPHVAYYSGMDYVPLPRARSLTDLVIAAEQARARFVFVSPIEGELRPELAVLMDSGLTVPGLRQVAYRATAPGKGAAMYLVEGALPKEAEQRRAVAQSLIRHPSAASQDGQVAIATELLHAGEYEQVVNLLTSTSALDRDNPDVAGLLSNAYHALGRYNDAARECLRAMRHGEGTAQHYDQLGRIRFRQLRYAEASQCFRTAIEMEPGDVDRRYLLGLAEFEQRHYAIAAREFEAYLALFPQSSEARRMTAISLARSGDRSGALRLLSSALGESDAGASASLRALADSLAAQ
ncbi:MAG TPA: tetratricopeptide repeat protein, partial [Candidatus Eisenbacteria bacterium]|nr:tetratricopeptide repeat protein [Candidatus Eisenbacteria bacterium]